MNNFPKASIFVHLGEMVAPGLLTTIDEGTFNPTTDDLEMFAALIAHFRTSYLLSHLSGGKIIISLFDHAMRLWSCQKRNCPTSLLVV